MSLATLWFSKKERGKEGKGKGREEHNLLHHLNLGLQDATYLCQCRKIGKDLGLRHCGHKEKTMSSSNQLEILKKCTFPLCFPLEAKPVEQIG